MSNKRRTGLGQGLGALLPTTPSTEPAEGRRRPTDEPGYHELPIDSILPNPYQPRTQMEEQALQELSDSIREHGIIQPLIVTQIEDGAAGARYRLIAGERRWRAAKRADLTTVPVIVREASDRDLLEMALIENIQRADLNALEEALAYQQMMEAGTLTQQEVAERVGKNRSTVANLLRLLRLPEPIQEMVRAGQLSEGHARQLIRLESASRMMEAADYFVAKKFSVRQAEEWVDRALREPTGRDAPGDQLSVQDRDIQRQFTSALGTRVELKRKKRGGHLLIHFENDEDLQGLYELFVSD